MYGEADASGLAEKLRRDALVYAWVNFYRQTDVQLHPPYRA